MRVRQDIMILIMTLRHQDSAAEVNVEHAGGIWILSMHDHWIQHA
jgi:hypothetical protein